MFYRRSYSHARMRLSVRATVSALSIALVASSFAAVAAPAVSAADPVKPQPMDVRLLPPLPSAPPAPNVVAPADPKADFGPLEKLNGTSGSHFDPKLSKLVSRSMFIDEYQNPDGTRTQRQSLEPLNAKDSTGAWQPVDTGLTVDETSKQVKVKRHPLNPVLAGQADNPALVSVQVDGKQVSLGIDRVAREAPRAAKAKVDGDRVEYPDVALDTDLLYEITPGSVKETIQLKKRPERGAAFAEMEDGFQYRCAHLGACYTLTGFR